MEILPRLHDLDIGPARFDQRIASGGNGRVLRAPELIAVGEIAVLAEQVGDDPTLVFVQWKDRGLGRYRRTAEQPRLQLRAGRRIGLRVVEQRQPVFLLRLRSAAQTTELQSLMRNSYAGL